LLAIYWLDLGAIGFFVAVALGFCAFAAMAVNIVLKLKKLLRQRLEFRYTATLELFHHGRRYCLRFSDQHLCQHRPARPDA
jgi:hypothetical protein